MRGPVKASESICNSVLKAGFVSHQERLMIKADKPAKERDVRLVFWGFTDLLK